METCQRFVLCLLFLVLFCFFAASNEAENKKSVSSGQIGQKKRKKKRRQRTASAEVELMVVRINRAEVVCVIVDETGRRGDGQSPGRYTGL